MRKLTDILGNNNGNNLHDLWNATAEADDYGPLPRGEYIARIIAGELMQSQTNSTPGYKLTFKILEGEFTGRQIWHDIWLTPAALPMAKRDLGKIGITSPEQLENPLPAGIRCKLSLVLRKDDDGIERNLIRRFEALGIDTIEHDVFAPREDAITNTSNDLDDSTSNPTRGIDNNKEQS